MANKGNHVFKDFISLIKDLIWGLVVIVALYGFLIFVTGSKNSIQFINVLVWPMVVVIVLIVFRKPLADFLRGITGRVTKFSITQLFAVELSLPEASYVPFDQLVPVSLQELASGAVNSDSVINLLKEIGKEEILDYAIVDLGAGQEWLTSRLFIFTLMLKRMRNLRCVVFLGTRCNEPRNFIGMALPDEVLWALSSHYPWLVGTYNKTYKTFPVHLLDPSVAANLVTTFLNDETIKNTNDRNNPPDFTGEWVSVEKGPSHYWQHAKWIDETCLKTDLGDALRSSEEVWYEDSLDTTKVNRAQAVLRRKGSFVAFINRGRVFKSLIDRETLLKQVAERVQADLPPV